MGGARPELWPFRPGAMSQCFTMRAMSTSRGCSRRRRATACCGRPTKKGTQGRRQSHRIEALALSDQARAMHVPLVFAGDPSVSILQLGPR